MRSVQKPALSGLPKWYVLGDTHKWFPKRFPRFHELANIRIFDIIYGHYQTHVELNQAKTFMINFLPTKKGPKWVSTYNHSWQKIISHSLSLVSDFHVDNTHGSIEERIKFEFPTNFSALQQTVLVNFYLYFSVKLSLVK